MNQAVTKELFRLHALGAKLHSVLRGHAHDIVVVKNIADMTHAESSRRTCARAHTQVCLHFHFPSVCASLPSAASRQSAEISILGSINVDTPSVFTSHIGLARTHVRALGCMHAHAPVARPVSTDMERGWHLGDLLFFLFFWQMVPSDEQLQPSNPPFTTHTFIVLPWKNKNDMFHASTWSGGNTLKKHFDLVWIDKSPSIWFFLFFFFCYCQFGQLTSFSICVLLAKQVTLDVGHWPDLRPAALFKLNSCQSQTHLFLWKSLLGFVLLSMPECNPALIKLQHPC